MGDTGPTEPYPTPRRSQSVGRNRWETLIVEEKREHNGTPAVRADVGVVSTISEKVERRGGVGEEGLSGRCKRDLGGGFRRDPTSPVEGR